MKISGENRHHFEIDNLIFRNTLALQEALAKNPSRPPFSKRGELWGIRWRIPSASSPFGKGG
jgi:hypothetical protein